MNSYWILHAGSENHCETRKSLKICYFRSKSIVPRSWTSRTETTDQQRAGHSESHGYWRCWWRVWYQRLCACNRAGGGHIEHNRPTVIKMMRCTTWHVWIFERENNCQSCYCLFLFMYTVFTVLMAQSVNLTLQIKFPKVVQAHTLGEVGNLGTVLWGFIPWQSFQFLLKLVYIWQTWSKI